MDRGVKSERLQEYLRKGKDREALALYAELEQDEPQEPRWPHRRGDLLLRLGRRAEAVAAYESAVRIYADLGFVARAVATAKVVLGIDPSRTDVLARVDPQAAGPFERERRSLADAPVLRPATDTAVDEVRFVDAADDEAVIEIDLTEIELSSGPPPAGDEAPRRTAAQLALLPTTPLFTEVPREALVTLLVGSELVDVVDGAHLLRNGDPADALYCIIDGAAEIRVPGVPEPVVLGEGEVVGESCLLDEALRRADVVARGELRALRVPKTVLLRLIEAHPRVGDLVLELLGRRLIANLLVTSPLFAAFDVPTRQAIARMFEVRRAAAGTQLVSAGKRSDGLYIPLTGKIEVERPGRAAVLLGRGRPFGQRSLLSHAPSDANVRTASDALVLRLPAARFTSLAALYPPALAHLADLATTDLPDA